MEDSIYKKLDAIDKKNWVQIKILEEIRDFIIKKEEKNETF